LTGEPLRDSAPVVYFSMDVALESSIPTYSGGLGVLAGDTLRTAADLELPMVGVSLVARAGYVRQVLDASGEQDDRDSSWRPESRLDAVEPVVSVMIEGRRVDVRAWRYTIRGRRGFEVPVYLLDTDLAPNSDEDRHLTDHLYGGDSRYRLSQEAVLGIGGVRMLEAMGYRDARAYHMNEGHAALLTLALLDELVGESSLNEATPAQIDAVRQRCVFTTHTPVPSGHDQFGWDLVTGVLGDRYAHFLREGGYAGDAALNMTYLALSLSRYHNAVSMRHAQVSTRMFPGRRIHTITNGVHTYTWAAPPLRELFDHQFPEWRQDPTYLRYAIDVGLDELRGAHASAKRTLIASVRRETGQLFDADTLTIGSARRATGYKRGDLILHDLEQLEAIVRDVGALQIIFAGKAHPKDESGKAMIRRIFEAGRALGTRLRVVYLQNYEMDLAREICAGVDLWLNTPLPPLEASGTSGMKAALNGVPSLSVLDGWWVEGHVEDVTGWAIGDGTPNDDPAQHAAMLYEQLERKILPRFYGEPEQYARVMRSAIALNGSFFTTQRMLQQYNELAYRI
jgi:starch phosphorylase